MIVKINMDPLSLTANIITLTATCLKTTKALSDLRSRYKHAQATISGLSTESTLICAALSQIQSVFLQRSDAIATQLRSRSQLFTTFDTALTGCSVVFAVLDDELQLLLRYGDNHEIGWVEKAKLLWKEDSMIESLRQLRGQQTAINLLLQVLQMYLYSIPEATRPE